MALVSRSMTGGEVRRPELACDQVAHGREGAGGAEYRVAACREVGRGSLVHRLDAADQRGRVAELVGRLHLRPAHLLPLRPQLGSDAASEVVFISDTASPPG